MCKCNQNCTGKKKHYLIFFCQEMFDKILRTPLYILHRAPHCVKPVAMSRASTYFSGLMRLACGSSSSLTKTKINVLVSLVIRLTDVTLSLTVRKNSDNNIAVITFWFNIVSRHILVARKVNVDRKVSEKAHSFRGISISNN